MKKKLIANLLITSFLFSQATCYAYIDTQKSDTDNSAKIINDKKPDINAELKNKPTDNSNSDPIIATYGSNNEVKESDVVKWMLSSPDFNTRKYKTLNFAEYPIPEQQQIIKQYIMSQIFETKVKESDIEKDPQIQSQLDMAKRTFLLTYFLQKNAPNLQDHEYTYYQRQLARNKVKISHILVNGEEVAKNVKERLSKGESFEELAAELSIDDRTKNQGGLIDQWITENEATEILKPVFEMKVGEISDPIKLGPQSWMIIKLNNKLPHIPSREEIQEATLQLRVQRYLAGLQEEANIKILIGGDNSNDNSNDNTKAGTETPAPVTSNIQKDKEKSVEVKNNTQQNSAKLPTKNIDTKKDNNSMPNKYTGTPKRDKK